jgi:hypothetical protein
VNAIHPPPTRDPNDCPPCNRDSLWPWLAVAAVIVVAAVVATFALFATRPGRDTSSDWDAVLRARGTTVAAACAEYRGGIALYGVAAYEALLSESAGDDWVAYARATC